MGMAVTTDLDRYEAALRAQGFARIAGADEAEVDETAAEEDAPAVEEPAEA